MRTKYEAPRIPSEREELFIGYVSKFHDDYGLSEDTLALFCTTDNRTIRTYKERYNNFKYIGHTPQGKLHAIKSKSGKYLYKLVRPDSRYARKFILKAEHNLVCAAIEKWNTRKILGTLQAQGQVSAYDILDMDYDELIELKNKLEVEMNE